MILFSYPSSIVITRDYCICQLFLYSLILTIPEQARFSDPRNPFAICYVCSVCSGSIDEYDEMFRGIINSYPSTQCIPVGFSMGGNLALKWLAENPQYEDRVLAAISCCQGYSAEG